MGELAKLLSFVRRVRRDANVSDAKVDTGGGPNITAEHFSTPGDDSHPLPGDFVLLVRVQQTGRSAAAGYLDPLNEQTAGPGERRLYARDSAGAIVSTIWLKNTGEVLINNGLGSVKLRPDGGTIVETPGATFDVGADGTVKTDNGAGSIELQASGNVVINNVTITPAGNVSTPTNITTPSAIVGGVEAAAHTHAQGPDSDGNTEQDVGPMQ